MSKVVTYTKNTCGFGVITLNRPEKRHAISSEMANQLKESLHKAEEDKVKFLILTGSGDRMFSSGGDLNELHGALTNEEALERLLPMKEVLEMILYFPVPVIAMLNGDALGGGCELATACDVRIAKEKTTFGFVQSNIGILPGWGGGALLYKKVDPSFAFDWLMKGNIYRAKELKNRGWIQQVVDKDEWENTESILEGYINKTYQQLYLLKKQYLLNIDAKVLPLQMVDEVKDTASLWDTDKHIMALKRFSKKK